MITDVRRGAARVTAPINMDWTAEAACSGELRLFFSFDRDDQAAAKARCAACPVIDACAAWAEAARPGHGIWAGKNYGI